jgi:extracellular factor (EF) 3-hydroxypalmitic acid methyl ester biosynthesis protein
MGAGLAIEVGASIDTGEGSAQLGQIHSRAAADPASLGWLDECGRTFAATGDVPAFINTLADGLYRHRSTVSADEWRRDIQHMRSHPVILPAYDCPMTRHAFNKPRGYPGDATLIDFMYQHGSIAAMVAQASAVGRAIFRSIVERPTPRDVRERRLLAARYIDAAVAAAPGARMLSVGCGALREHELSLAASSGCISEFVALDSDVESLDMAAREADGRERRYVKPMLLDVRQLIGAGAELGTFDLIYALGLYDYLPSSFARRLTQRLFRLVRPGGKLLIASFLPISESGYAEAVMDWWITYRSRSEIKDLVDLVPASDAAVSYFATRNECIGILDIARTT